MVCSNKPAKLLKKAKYYILNQNNYLFIYILAIRKTILFYAGFLFYDY
jgi:hypothetical protein